MNLLTPARGAASIADTIDISHESLIRQWSRLKHWVKKEADAADTYRLLTQTSSRWSEQAGGDLWTGHNLDTVLDWVKNEKPNLAWAARYGGDFDHALRFIEASKEKRRRDLDAAEAAKRQEALLKWRGRIAIVAGIGLLTAIGLSVWAFWERDKAQSFAMFAALAKQDAVQQANQARKSAAEAIANEKKAEASEQEAKTKEALAERQSEFADSLILASKAQNLSTRFPVRSILLNAQAIKTAQRVKQVNVEAENVLRRTLGRIGGFTLASLNGIEDAGPDAFISVAFSPDGRTVAAAYNGGVVLWDAVRALLPGVLRVNEGFVESSDLEPRRQGHRGWIWLRRRRPRPGHRRRHPVGCGQPGSVCPTCRSSFQPASFTALHSARR